MPETITAPEPAPEPVTETTADADDVADIAPDAGAPMPDSMTPGDSMSSTYGGGGMSGGGGGTMPAAGANGGSAPPAGDAPPPAAGCVDCNYNMEVSPPPPPAPVAAPVTLPPAGANGHGPKATPAAKNGHRGSKVLSYFQKTRTQIDTRRAFGFVLMPKVAVTDEDKRVQKDFCTIILASMDFMTPGAVASAPREVLATYWPVVASRASFEINEAFATRNCNDLIAWYDHRLARGLAAKAGVAELSGPLLITWPSSGAEGEAARDPLIVDFSKANHERATKALQYWFRQLRGRPDLWTSRIREGTIRAELADAVNDTAGVMLAVLSGKWDSLTVVTASP